ncbi:hypothetical protein ACSBR1_012435 [Camellia fascicularis]
MEKFKEFTLHPKYSTPHISLCTDPAAQVHRKRAGGFRGVEFSEGWVEFSRGSIAKRVVKMLNGEQIGGRKRSAFFYDLWNIKARLLIITFRHHIWDPQVRQTLFGVLGLQTGFYSALLLFKWVWPRRVSLTSILGVLFEPLLSAHLFSPDKCKYQIIMQSKYRITFNIYK